MPVVVVDGKCQFIKLTIAPDEITGLLAAHRKVWRPAGPLEETARALCRDDFPDDPSAQFAEDVIWWGRGQRNASRFRKENSNVGIASALRNAVALVDRGSVSQAVAELQKLKHLRQSFASKLVRFLRPESAVILDGVIRSSLGYREDQTGYQQFLSDCEAILEIAREQFPLLRVCDIEAAVFAKVQGYK